MKRLFIFLLIIVCIMASRLTNTDAKIFSFYDIFPNNQIYTYSDTRLTLDDVNLGFAYMSEQKSIFAIGESAILTETQLQYLSDILDYDIVKIDHIDDIEISYAYTRNIKKCLYTGDKKFNLQLAKTASRIVVGWPVIYGSI